MAKLVLIRHGESEWNEKGLWTGLTDISLSDKGREEAKKAAEQIQDIPFEYVFTSPLKRAIETYEIIKDTLGLSLVQTENAALNERDYGDFTGKNKWDIQKEIGEEEFKKIRRGWDEKIPNGETLKDVYNRVAPFYSTEIEPLLKAGKNVLVVAHGNSLRALVKLLENISDEEIKNIEIATGEVWIYSIDGNGQVENKIVKHD